jgi:hypothetical protein
MPKSSRPEPLYQRGQPGREYRLYQRPGRNLEIVWYDPAIKRERSASAGTRDVRKGIKALDRLFLNEVGAQYCPTCHRPWDSAQSPLLSDVIADYLVLNQGTAGADATRHRLAHVVDYLADRPDTRCAHVDERWIGGFRTWLLAKPVATKTGNGVVTRPRTLGSAEGSVLQLAAAINAATGQRAAFKAQQMADVARSPTYRADIKQLAAMFRFALAEPHRINLLRYLRFGVATWARPDAILEARPGQWFSEARVLDLNPLNRPQTRKHRPKVPIARQFAPFLDNKDAFIPAASVRASWEKMRAELKLPGGREAGVKLIRRSVSTIARKRIGETNWRQGEMMLGHVKASVSDIYALPDPANLGLALAATESIIDDINALVPGAFYDSFTATGNGLKVLEGGLSA